MNVLHNYIIPLTKIIINRIGENILRRINQTFAKTIFEFSSEITIALFIMKPANNVLIPDTNNVGSDVISLTDIAKEELAEQKLEEE